MKVARWHFRLLWSLAVVGAFIVGFTVGKNMPPDAGQIAASKSFMQVVAEKSDLESRIQKLEGEIQKLKQGALPPAKL